MQEGTASRTAMGAARLRAAHQVLDGGRVFADPFALRILGVDASDLAAEGDADRSRRALRWFIACRSRFAEDALALAGSRQVVILGAGLDTYAYRHPQFAGRIFEVDHPATQQWKRERLAAAGIEVPDNLTFTPVDFERQVLAHELAHSGFDDTQATFFTWLGVVPYLSEPAIYDTLAFIAALPGGAHIAFDYANPDSGQQALERRVAEAGEALQTYFETEPFVARLRALGFRAIEDLSPRDIAARYMKRQIENERGGHLMHAATLD